MQATLEYVYEFFCMLEVLSISIWCDRRSRTAEATLSTKVLKSSFSILIVHTMGATRVNCKNRSNGKSENELLSSAEKLEKLLLLANPYLEKNDPGAGHTKRVLEKARKRLNIPVEAEELAVASIILHD